MDDDDDDEGLDVGMDDLHHQQTMQHSPGKVSFFLALQESLGDWGGLRRIPGTNSSWV